MEFKESIDGDIKRIQLVDGQKILLTVAETYGAKLTNLKLKKTDGYHEVLYPVSSDELRTNNRFEQSILFPYPNRLEDGVFEFEGKKYQFPINEPDVNNQLHGLIFNAPFSVDHARVEGEVAEIQLTHSYDGREASYPFPFELIVNYKYVSGSLKVGFEITNTGEGALPFGFGWHPYFQIDGLPVEDYNFKATSLESIVLSDRSLPTGAREHVGDKTFILKEHNLDNAYFIKDAPYKYFLETKSGVKLNFEVSDSLNYLQLYIPPERTSIAIEPMTCNINALNNGDGLSILQPSETFSCTVKMYLS